MDNHLQSSIQITNINYVCGFIYNIILQGSDSTVLLLTQIANFSFPFWIIGIPPLYTGKFVIVNAYTFVLHKPRADPGGRGGPGPPLKCKNYKKGKVLGKFWS